MLLQRLGKVDDVIIQFGDLATLDFDRLAHSGDFGTQLVNLFRLFGEGVGIVLNDTGDGGIGNGLDVRLGAETC